MKPPRLDLWADLNAEDDNGLNWSVVDHAHDPSLVVPGAVLIAGVEGYWSVVRVHSVDDDGQVHFEQLSDDHPDARRVLAGARDG